MAFRPDGKTIASAGFDGMVRLNDPATGKLIKEFIAGAAEGGRGETNAVTRRAGA